MGIPELDALSNGARQWLDRAIEAYDEQEYEAVDAAYRMSAGQIELAHLEIERQRLEISKARLEMERERHRFDMKKKREALEALNKIKAAAAEPVKPSGWDF